MGKFLIGADTASDDAVTMCMALRHPDNDVGWLHRRRDHSREPGRDHGGRDRPTGECRDRCALAPDIAEKIERVVMMGGSGVHGPGIVSPTAEFNFWVDSEALRVVLRSGMPLELVGWDISIASAVVAE